MKTKVKVKKAELFSMDDWEDERLMRREIKHGMQCIAQNANANEVKAHFSNTKDNGDGIQTLKVEFAETIKENGKTKHVFWGNDFISVTFNPDRKFPKKKSREDEEGSKKELPTFVKWRP